jgi:hypothetical protein
LRWFCPRVVSLGAPLPADVEATARIRRPMMVRVVTKAHATTGAVVVTSQYVSLPTQLPLYQIGHPVLRYATV